MIERKEKNVGLSLFDEAAQIIKKIGIYEKEFASQEAVGIMSGFVISIIRGHGAEKLSISRMEVLIENTRGIISGTVEVKSPDKVTIGMKCILDNHTEPDKLKLTDLDITTKAGLAARLALKAANVVGRTRESLQKPNEAFLQFLSAQFSPGGVTLTKLGLQFN